MKHLIVLSVIFTVVVGVCMSSWDYVPPKPARDIADTVVVVPASVYREYGFTDRTRVYYNLERVLLVLKVTQAEVLSQGDRIKVLESQVRTLIEKEDKVKEVTDPNEVAK